MGMRMAAMSVRRRACLLMVLAVAVTGCINVGFSTRTFGTDIEGLKAEAAYNNVYSREMANLHVQMQAFAPSGTNPGVCNVGGSKQACYDTDVAVIEAMNRLIAALEATSVPPRFVNADALLRAAFRESIRGLELRNQAIENNDNAAWAEHQTVLQAAQQATVDAYAAYPEDNRPLPVP
jgi:hypothetical protein